MKRKQLSKPSLLITLLILTIIGCKKEEDNKNTFTDPRDGQVYKYVEIGNQTWMAENLNFDVGNNWCYDNNPDNCDKYGRLYDWETARTACPSGWHLPNDLEWKVLEGTVDSQYPVGHPMWDLTLARGLDAGKNLKSTSGWSENGNGTDIFGFEALPAGIRSSDGSFQYLGKSTNWWSSPFFKSTNGWNRSLYYLNDKSIRYNFETGAVSVRCIKD